MERKIEAQRLIDDQSNMTDFSSFERDPRDLDDLVDGFWMPRR